MENIFQDQQPGVEAQTNKERVKKATAYIKMLDSQFGINVIKDVQERQNAMEEANEASKWVNIGATEAFELSQELAKKIRYIDHADDFGLLYSSYKEGVSIREGLDTSRTAVAEAMMKRGDEAKKQLFGSDNIQLLFK